MAGYTSRKADGEVAEPFVFPLDEVEFSCTGEPSILDLGEVYELRDYSVRSPRVSAALGRVFRGALGKEGYEKFREHCREHQTQPEVFVDVLSDMVAWYADFPTRRSGRSSPGPKDTAPTSPDDSPPPASPRARKRAAASKRSSG